MKVSELIEELKKQDSDANVYFCLDRELEIEDDYFAIGTNVTQIENDPLFNYDSQLRCEEDTLEEIRNNYWNDNIDESVIEEKSLEKLKLLEKLEGVFIRIN